MNPQRGPNSKRLQRSEWLESHVNIDVILICLASALLVLPLSAAFFMTGADRSWMSFDLLSTLPAPDSGAPFIIMSSSGAEFPLYAAQLFSES